MYQTVTLVSSWQWLWKHLGNLNCIKVELDMLSSEVGRWQALRNLLLWTSFIQRNESVSGLAKDKQFYWSVPTICTIARMSKIFLSSCVKYSFSSNCFPCWKLDEPLNINSTSTKTVGRERWITPVNPKIKKNWLDRCWSGASCIDLIDLFTTTVYKLNGVSIWSFLDSTVQPTCVI